MKINIKLDGPVECLLRDRKQVILDSFQKGMRAAARSLEEYALIEFAEVMKRIRCQELIAKIRSLKARGLL